MATHPWPGALLAVCGLLSACDADPVPITTRAESPSQPPAGLDPSPTSRDEDRDEGPDPDRGAALYGRYCATCHGPDGDGDSVNAHYMPGIEWSDFRRPNFVADRGEARLRLAISGGGRGVSGGSKWMPAWGNTLDDGATRDLVAFLVSLPRRPRAARENLSTSDQAGCATCHRVAGKELVRQANCAGCHQLEGFERREVAPDLAGVGRKFTRQFLYRFLRAPFNRRQPGYRPGEVVRMPDFSLSVQERIELTEYLSTLDRLDLPGPFVQPAESGEALAARATELLDRHACLACHKLGADGGKVGPDLTDLGSGEWKTEWVYHWILDPRRYFPESPMPDLGLTPGEAAVLATWLTGRGSPTSWTEGHAGPTRPGVAEDPAYPDLPEVERAASAGRGRDLFEALGCRGCHANGDDEPAALRIGPRLDAAGIRLRREWAFEFLDAPRRIRPGLAPARMPRMRFTSDEIGSVLQYLADHGEARWGSLRARYEGDRPAAPGDGRALFVEKDCQSCHVRSDEAYPPALHPYYSPEETARRKRWSPDLAHAGRLERWWARAWLDEPEAFGPDPLMPRIGLDPAAIERLLDHLAEDRE